MSPITATRSRPASAKAARRQLSACRVAVPRRRSHSCWAFLWGVSRGAGLNEVRIGVVILLSAGPEAGCAYLGGGRSALAHFGGLGGAEAPSVGAAEGLVGLGAGRAARAPAAAPPRR